LKDLSAGLPVSRIPELLTPHSAESQLQASSEALACLLKQQRLYEAALSHNPDPVYTFDLEGRFTYVNNALLDIWGITWEQAIGKSLYELNYETWQADKHMRELREVVSTKKPLRSDVPYHGMHGLRVYEYIFVPVLDADGNVEAITGSTRDITERYEAEKMAKDAESRQRLALEASHSFGIWNWDIKNNLFVCDQRLGEVFNLTPEEASQGVPIERPQESIHPDDINDVNAVIQDCIATGNFYDQRYRLVQQDGSIRWGAFRGRPIYDEDGQAVSFPGVGVDITTEQNALNALKEADKRKDEFLATLAHELRNPLAPIRNSLEILRADFSPQQKEEAFRQVDRQVSQLVRLVDDLMDVSRITRGKIRVDRAAVNLCEAIQDAIETVQPLIDAQKQSLTFHGPEDDVWVNGDQIRLAQIFTNIINNAAKYTPDKGRISIALNVTSSTVSVDITDTGVGIPADKLSGIFEMFSQVEDVLERSQGGLGIGLTLVKRLIELHDGQIAVQSSNQGTCVTVSLPLLHAHEQTAQHNPSSAVELPVAVDGPLSVLIADDNQDAAITMGWILEAKGCDVTVVEDGPSALRAVKQISPDLFLLDIGMPGMNGYDLCIALREMSPLKHAVFVAQTGWGQPEHIHRSKQAGFHHHLVKPLNMNDLVPIVNRVREQKTKRQGKK